MKLSRSVLYIALPIGTVFIALLWFESDSQTRVRSRLPQSTSAGSHEVASVGKELFVSALHLGGGSVATGSESLSPDRFLQKLKAKYEAQGYVLRSPNTTAKSHYWWAKADKEYSFGRYRVNTGEMEIVLFWPTKDERTEWKSQTYSTRLSPGAARP